MTMTSEEREVAELIDNMNGCLPRPGHEEQAVGVCAAHINMESKTNYLIRAMIYIVRNTEKNSKRLEVLTTEVEDLKNYRAQVKTTMMIIGAVGGCIGWLLSLIITAVG